MMRLIPLLSSMGLALSLAIAAEFTVAARAAEPAAADAQAAPINTASDHDAQADNAQQNEPNRAAGDAMSSRSNKPIINLSTSQNSFVLDAQEKVLPWEEWHHRVAKAIAKRMRRSTGTMLGTSLIKIIVYKDHRVEAEILDSKNPRLGQVCVDVARSFNADPILEFPFGSHRDAIAFNLQYKRNFFTFGRDEHIHDDYESLTGNTRDEH